MRILEGATGVFFTGGDQLKITSQIGDTPLYSRVQEIFEAGGVIAGTSAGASAMSETMLVANDGEASYRIKSALLMAPGLGLAQDMLIDQHFSERGRMARLIGAVSQNPRVLGVGIDEDTAIIVEHNRSFVVLGSGAVYIVDGFDDELLQHRRGGLRSHAVVARSHRPHAEPGRPVRPADAYAVRASGGVDGAREGSESGSERRANEPHRDCAAVNRGVLRCGLDSPCTSTSSSRSRRFRW
jgi:cyanophycinase-like exopeptidase